MVPTPAHPAQWPKHAVVPGTLSLGYMKKIEPEIRKNIYFDVFVTLLRRPGTHLLGVLVIVF